MNGYERRDFMARFEKYTTHAAAAMLFHNSREFPEGFSPANIDIDSSRSALNYSLNKNATTLKECKIYFKKRLSEIYCYKNAELKTLGQWVITAPADLPTELERAFFQSAHDYMNSLYGEKNCIQSIVHMDEGVKNDKGEIVAGRPHLHYSFIPATENKKYLQKDGRGCISKQNHYKEKCCVHDIINKQHLREFNSGLQKMCNERGIKCTIANNATAGGNRSVAQLKDKTRIELLEKERNQLKEQLKELEYNKQNNPWSKGSSGWSKGEKTWNYEEEY